MRRLIAIGLLAFTPGLFALEILSFQANALGVFQVGGESFSAQAAWTPELALDDVWALRGELGLTLLKAATTSHFFATNYEAHLVCYLVPALALELGGGLNAWHGNGGAHPIASFYLVGVPPGPFSRLFLGYSRAFLRGDPANEIKLGIGFSL